MLREIGHSVEVSDGKLVKAIFERRLAPQGFTFKRNDKQSQIDWCFANEFSMRLIKNFRIIREFPKISDHDPIYVKVEINGEKSINTLVKGAKDLNQISSNHSRIPIINKMNTNLKCLNNLLKLEVEKKNISSMSSHEIAKFLTTNVQRFGKIAKIPFSSRRTDDDQFIDTDKQYEKLFEKYELEKWRFVNESNDCKKLWNAINMKGEIKEETDSSINVDELANISSGKSKIDISQAIYTDLTTDVKHDLLDKDIDQIEITEAINKCKDSKTSDGIPISIVKEILPTIMNLLIVMFNMIFTGGRNAYPSNWLSFINAIPKKGKLDPPKFVRFISVMGIFEKIYQVIINNRLYKFIKIPTQQSAYQKGKGCNLHVMAIRILKILTVKTKQKLFIIFTDFEAAFDLVSRRILFQKLINMGISAIMLNALIAMYISSKSVVEYNNEFSDYIVLLAGVKQGAPTSGLLYIVYTLGIIDIYNQTFNPEPLIYIYHLLMHADDILLLATSRTIAIAKIKLLLNYCNDNYIRLQTKKCAIMCVNSNDISDSETVLIENLSLKPTTCEIYLGSAITNSTKLIDDVNADIKNRQISVVKYFAFLRSNLNAPIDIKIKVLNACIMSSLLYYSETWTNSQINRLQVVYRRMLKSILGVGMTTCSEFLYIELGVLPIRSHIMIKQWEFWKKINDMSDENPIIYIVKKARQFHVKEIKYYDSLIERYSCKEEIVTESFENIKNTIRAKAIAGRSKYLTYLLVNPEIETPKIYSKVKKRKYCQMVAKLRTSSHNLQIEMGRRNRKIREHRLCQCKKIEDEKHFLQECENYKQIQQKYNTQNIPINEILKKERFVPYLVETTEKRKEITLQQA